MKFNLRLLLIALFLAQLAMTYSVPVESDELGINTVDTVADVDDAADTRLSKRNVRSGALNLPGRQPVTFARPQVIRPVTAPAPQSVVPANLGRGGFHNPTVGRSNDTNAVEPPLSTS